MREINLSDYTGSRSGDYVSYLLVDKGDYTADGQVVVRQIDDNSLDVVMDPSVYVLNAGKHTLSFSFYDSKKQGQRLDDILVVTLEPRIYYQVMAIRSNDKMQFKIMQVPKEKLSDIGKRELKTMTNYLLHGEN